MLFLPYTASYEYTFTADADAATPFFIYCQDPD